MFESLLPGPWSEAQLEMLCLTLLGCSPSSGLLRRQMWEDKCGKAGGKQVFRVVISLQAWTEIAMSLDFLRVLGRGNKRERKEAAGVLAYLHCWCGSFERVLFCDLAFYSAFWLLLYCLRICLQRSHNTRTVWQWCSSSLLSYSH